jgi:aquaporin Z
LLVRAGRPRARSAGELQRTGIHHGLHWAEWIAELVGTALLLVGGVSAICLDFGPHHPPLPHTLRLLLTGLLFAGSGSLVAVSPLGRRSGAHLNPAVSLGFFVQRHLSRGDLLAYVLAQCAGAVLGAAVIDLLWGHTARALLFGLTQPGDGLVGWQAALVEAAMTATLVGGIFFFVSSPRTTRWTPVMTWLVVAGFVWACAPFTGTSLNPARSLGPAVLAPSGHDYWVYVVGPVAGALLACAGWALVRSRSTLTAKLFHDPAYRSVMRSELPVAAQTSHDASPPGTPTPGS